MSFFLKKGSKIAGKKRKSNGVVEGKKKKKRNKDDEEIDSDDSELFGDVEDDDEDMESLSDGETSDQKRVRLAKIYLEEIEKEEKERLESNEVRDSVNARIVKDALEEKGKLLRRIAGSVKPIFPSEIKTLRDKTHCLSLISLAISEKHLFTGSKDGGLIQWSLKDFSKLVKIKGGRKKDLNTHVGHCGPIYALAVSTHGKFLASGGEHKLINIWDTEGMSRIKVFHGHRDSVSGLAFRMNSHTLFSCSFDRSVKVWNLDEMTYVETLFGHQDKITGIDAGRRERAITSGGRDGSVRVWKIVEESQLVFNGPAVSTDSVKLINEEHFATCGEDGHISIWGLMKKKPLCTLQKAHGADPNNGEPMWISAIASYQQSDLIASGSRDGFIRLWKCENNFRSLKEIQSIPVKGFINSLAFSLDGNSLFAAIGQEHRLGRWWRTPEAKNSILCIPISFEEEDS